MRNRPFLVLGLFAASSLAVFVACSGDDNAATPGTPSGDAGGDSTIPIGDDDDSGPGTGDAGNDGAGPVGDDGGTDAPVTNDAGILLGPTAIAFPDGGSPDTILWDDAKKTLFVADDNNNQVWTWTDATGFAKYGTVPDNGAADEAGATYIKLNGIAELADGTLVIARFGKGTYGAIYTLSPDGGTTAVPGVNAIEKRLEVATDPATGVIYSNAFTGSGGATVGSVETVNLTTGTTTYATGFIKPVGLLVQGGNLFVSDEGSSAAAGALYVVPTDPTLIADGGAGLVDGGPFPYITVYSPDMISAGPNGSILTDQFQAAPDGGTEQIRQIFLDGGVATYTDAGFNALYDVAYDHTNARIFVVDHAAAGPVIWILPAH